MEKRNNDILCRGTTPTHSFTLPDELKEVELAALYITYRQDGKTVIEKDRSSISIEDGVASVRLTQEETLLFSDRWKCHIQVRLRTAAGDALVSNVIDIPVYDVLKEGVI